MAGCERNQPDVHQVLGDVPAGHPRGCVAWRKSAHCTSAPSQPGAETQHQAASLTLSDGHPTRYLYKQHSIKTYLLVNSLESNYNVRSFVKCSIVL